MKLFFAPILLGLALAAGNVQAAPPSPAQVERLLEVMDAQKIIDQLVPAMMQQSSMLMDQQLTRSDADEADRARAQRMMAAQEASLRDLMAWDKLKPIYVSVYTEAMTSEEVEAMARFYESPEGRSVMQKMPQVMQLTMQKMQPMAESAMEKMMADLEAAMGPEKK